MVFFCAFINIVKLQNLNAALSFLPFLGITGLYAWALYGRKG
jgi:hypothetical protein